MTTMQNVACAMTTVQMESSTDRMVRNAVRRASAVTMPGSAIGRITSNDNVFLPKNEYRLSANDSIEPSTIATSVATRPTLTDVHTASRTPVLCQTCVHQCS